MSLTRRHFLHATALALAACKAPAIVSSSHREVASTLLGMPTSDGAGVRLTRVIGQPRLRNLDPFLMLDRFHSDDPGAYIAGFPNHPHRGFETVTVMLDGRMRHRDSVGNSGLIQGGGVQWMTAGRGIIHSEMPEQERGLMSGFQLWVNLPAREKMRAPAYQDLQPDRIAEGRLPGGSLLRVQSGTIDGLTGPVPPRTTQPVLATVMLEDDRPLAIELPAQHQAFVFVHAGELEVGPENRATTVGEGTLAILGPGRTLRLRATHQRAGVLVAAAKPLGEPIAQRGPFVMNTDAEIRKAYEDYRNGVLDKG